MRCVTLSLFSPALGLGNLGEQVEGLDVLAFILHANKKVPFGGFPLLQARQAPGAPHACVHGIGVDLQGALILNDAFGILFVVLQKVGETQIHHGVGMRRFPVEHGGALEIARGPGIVSQHAFGCGQARQGMGVVGSQFQGELKRALRLLPPPTKIEVSQLIPA